MRNRKYEKQRKLGKNNSNKNVKIWKNNEIN